MADSFRQRRASEAAGRDGVGWRNAREGSPSLSMEANKLIRLKCEKACSHP